MVANKAASGQVEDLFLGQPGIECPIEFAEWFHLPEGGDLDPTSDQSFLAHQQFVLENQFQKLGMGKLMPGGFLQPHIERLSQA